MKTDLTVVLFDALEREGCVEEYPGNGDPEVLPITLSGNASLARVADAVKQATKLPILTEIEYATKQVWLGAGVLIGAAGMTGIFLAVQHFGGLCK